MKMQRRMKMTTEEILTLVKKLERRVSELEKICETKSDYSEDSTVFFANWDSSENAQLPSLDDCDDDNSAHLLDGCRGPTEAVTQAFEMAAIESWSYFNVFAFKGGKVSFVEAWEQDESGGWFKKDRPCFETLKNKEKKKK
jgi:hypothetical protein